jgi:hypothetical protein
VQPLLDLLGRQPEFFVARGNTAADIVTFSLVFTLLPPAVMAMAVWLLGCIRPVLGWGLQRFLVGVLVAAIALPPVGDLLAGSALSVGLALAVGGAAAFAYSRASGVQAFLTVLSPASVFFLVLFLVLSPASKLVLPSGEGEAVAGAVRSDTPVVVVFFDELPTTSLMDARGRVDSRRFPAFAALAQDATWYRNATTVAADTTEAVPALLTGERPEEGLLPTSRDHPRSLFTLLGRSHRLEVVEPVTDVCPPELCRETRPGMGSRLRHLAADVTVVSAHLFLPDNLRGGLPAINRGWAGFGDEDVGAVPAAVTPGQEAAARADVLERLGQDDPSERVEQVLGAVDREASRPPLLFLHSTLPHGPWRFLPDGSQYTFERGAFPGLTDEQWGGDQQWLANQGFQRHLVQTQYADRLLLRFLRKLRSVDLYDRALIVVAADHGVSFRAGEPRREPTSANFQDIAGVPLFVKAPGQREGRVDESAVRTIDVLPTIANELGVELPWRLDGIPVGTRGDSTDAPIDVTSGPSRTTVSFREFLRKREMRRRYERSLLQAAAYDIFAMGTRPELVGQRVDAIGTLSAGVGRARVDVAESFAAVRPNSGVLPAFISGSVVGVAKGAELAVALNGRVEATTRIQANGRQAEFTALVRPDSFRRGANTVAVFELVAGRLRPLGRVAREAPYELVQGDEGEILVRPGERIPIQPGAATGFVDFATVEGRALTVTGWAATGDKKDPAELVVAVSGQRSLRFQRPSVLRNDLRKFGTRTRMAGFQLALPKTDIGAKGLRIFAIANGRATELPPVGNVSGVVSSLAAE